MEKISQERLNEFLRSHEWWLKGRLDEKLQLSNYDLSGLDFSSRDLTSVSFINCDLTNADFYKAQLYNCNFRNSILENAYLNEAFGIENANLSCTVGVFK